MTCTGDGSTGTIKTQDWLFENWARTQRVLVPVVYNPTKVEHIVNAVLEVEARAGTLKAVGSGWAYGAVAVDDSVGSVINTAALKRVLNGVLAENPPTALIPFALRDQSAASAKYLVHVEGGIKVHDLNCRLDALGLAMPTLGGSNGQALAGVIATGTHGTDVDAPPIADAVQAIHLVGPGGKEWWIERDYERGAITDLDRMAEAKQRGLLCADARVEYDTSLFRAVLVSLGRMGVVYSYVLRAVDAFTLRTNRRTGLWTTESAALRNVASPYGANRWLEIFVNPYPNAAGDHDCVVSTKNPATGTIQADAPIVKNELAYFCESPHITEILVAVQLGLPLVVATVVATASATLAPLNGIPIVGPFVFASAMAALVAPFALLQTALAALFVPNPGANFAELLANVVNLLVTAGQKSVIPLIVSSLAGSVRPLAEDGTIKESFRSYTGQRMCPEVPAPNTNCERQMEGMELAFDMTPGKTNLFDFVDDVFAEADRLFAADQPAAFGMSLRFTAATEALLGMQQWSRTCSVEIFALRGVASTSRFFTKLYELGEKHGANPHWGLMHELTAAQVRNHYPKLSEWRQALRFIIDGGGGRAETFQSRFSIARGLEPEQYMPPTVVVTLDPNGETDPYDFGTLQLHDRKSVTFHFAAAGQHQLRVLGHDADGGFALKDIPASSLLGTPMIPHNLEVDYVASSAQPGEEIRVRATVVGTRAGVVTGRLRLIVNAANVTSIVIPIRARVESFALEVARPSPAVIDLGAVAIDDTKTVTFDVRNDSTLVAWLTEAIIADPVVAQEIGVETGPIGIGQTRAYTLTYRPSHVGAIEVDVALRFTDGISPSQHARSVGLKVRATGRGAQAQLAPRTIDFGEVPVGGQSSPRGITVTNIGLETLTLTGTSFNVDFPTTPPPTSIAGGASAQIEVVFRPTGPGVRVSAFTLASNSLAAPEPVELVGLANVDPVLRATPAQIGFPDTVAGSARITRLVVSNPGASPVAIGAVALQATGDFRILKDTCSGANLAVGAACLIDLAFAPAQPGPKASEIAIPGTLPPLRVALSGDALPAIGLVPNVSDIDFGALAVGALSSVRVVTLTNRAATPATITSVGVVGTAAAEVAVVTTDCTGAVLAPGASCSVQLQFRPGAIGTRAAALTANADVVSHDATLHASGLGAAVEWTLSELDFGDAVIANQTPYQSTSLRNIGNANLAILQTEVLGDAADFVITPLVPGLTRLGPNGDMGFRIRFRPTVAGLRTATLRIHTDSPASPHEMVVRGVGFTAHA